MDGFNKVKGVALSVLKGISFYILLVLIFSAVFWLFSINETYIPIIKSGLSFLTAFLTGLWSAKNGSDKGYLRGLFSGIFLVLLFMAISLIFGGESLIKSAVTYFIMIIISISGGIIGINAKK